MKHEVQKGHRNRMIQPWEQKQHPKYRKSKNKRCDNNTDPRKNTSNFKHQIRKDGKTPEKDKTLLLPIHCEMRYQRHNKNLSIAPQCC